MESVVACGIILMLRFSIAASGHAENKEIGEGN